MSQQGTIALREATGADRAFLLDVRKQGLREDVVRVWGSWDDDRQGCYIDRLLSAGEVRVVCCDGADVGMLTVERREGSLHVENIVLLPPVQVAGVGTRLLSDVSRRADGLGLPSTLEVLRASRARGLYERLGFVSNGETDTHVRMRQPPAG